MSSTKKLVLWILLVILSIPITGFLYLYFRHPSVAPPSDIKVEMTPERIERGKYIFTVLSDCDGCHSLRDFTKLAGPIVESGRGQGVVFDLDGLPGKVVASNITPDKETGIGGWTDGEKIRAIREGIDKDGNPLFPLMPYSGYRYMSDYDVQSLVAYLNTLRPIRNPLPKTMIDFPVSMMIKGVPAPVRKPVATPNPNSDEYGEYLATLGGCQECHTPMKRGQKDLSMSFAGGREFSSGGSTVISANITPDLETGIGRWDFARFLERMRSYRQYHGDPPKVGPERFTLMPWYAFEQLTDADLAAIFKYIKSRPPITNKVVPHPGHPEISGI